MCCFESQDSAILLHPINRAGKCLIESCKRVRVPLVTGGQRDRKGTCCVLAHDVMEPETKILLVIASLFIVDVTSIRMSLLIPDSWLVRMIT
jgi:hypothetical protein